MSHLTEQFEQVSKVIKQVKSDQEIDKQVDVKSTESHFGNNVSQDIWKERIIQFLKNVWRTHYWWLHKYKIDPPILSADQMLLHCNESSSQKTLNFKGRDQHCFVKENHYLSREPCSYDCCIFFKRTETTPIRICLQRTKGLRQPPRKS